MSAITGQSRAFTAISQPMVGKKWRSTDAIK